MVLLEKQVHLQKEVGAGVSWRVSGEGDGGARGKRTICGGEG